MYLDNALEYAKRGENKVPYSIKIPESIKEKFEFMCKEYNLPMSSVIIGLMRSAISDYTILNGKSKFPLLSTAEIIRRLEDTKKALIDFDNNIYEAKLKKGKVDFLTKTWSYYEEFNDYLFTDTIIYCENKELDKADYLHIFEDSIKWIFIFKDELELRKNILLEQFNYTMKIDAPLKVLNEELNFNQKKLTDYEILKNKNEFSNKQKLDYLIYTSRNELFYKILKGAENDSNS